MFVFLAILMYALWAVMFSFAKVALQYAPPVFLTSARMLIAALILLLYLFIAKRSSFKLRPIQWLSMALLGFFSVYITNILEFWSLQYLPAAKACFIYSLSPIFAIFFSYLHFGEKMNSRKWAGLALGLAGVVPVLVLKSEGEGLLSGVSFLSLPSLAMIGAALASVYGWILLRLLVKGHNISPLMASGSSMFFGGSMALIHSAFVDSWSPTPVATGTFLPFIGWVLLMVLVSNLICYNLYGFLLRRFTASFLSFMGLLSPLFASLHGWAVLGEAPSWLIFLSTGIVSCGLWFVYSAELKQGYTVASNAMEKAS